MKMRKKKDCLFLCQFFYPEYVSSATLPFDTAVWLAMQGYRTGALCGYPNEYHLQNSKIPSRERYRGVDIKRLRYLPFQRTGFVGRALNYASFFINVFLHVPYMGRYEVIFVYSNPPLLPFAALMAKKLFGCQIIFISYDVYPEIGLRTGKIGERSLICRFMRAMNWHIKTNADLIVALSSDMKDFYLRERNMAPEKLKVIPNWYDGNRKSDLSEDRNPLFSDLPDKAFVVSYLGNLGICQELRTVLEAIRLLKDEKGIYFLFAGHGNQMPCLKAAVESEGLKQVRVLGFLQGKDYLDALSVSSMCMVTLVKGMRGLCSPSKVYGYMMASKPVVAVMERGMELGEDIARNGCGCVIEPGDAEGLANTLVKLKNQPRELIAMGLQGRRLFETKYDKDVCLNQYAALMKERLGR